MSFTEQDLTEMPWDFIQKVTFLKNEIVVIFRSGNGLTAKPPDNKTSLQFYEEAKKNLKQDQIEIGDLPNDSN